MNLFVISQVLPIGDPIGNRPVSEVKDFDKRDWELLGRCDSRELCNGVTAVRYLVCKTWREGTERVYNAEYLLLYSI